MSYGLPCPDKMDPQQVFTYVEQFDGMITSVVEAVMSQIQQAQYEAGGLIGSTLDTLVTWIKKQLAAIDKLLGQVISVLQTQLVSQTFVVNSSLMTTINDIATNLQTTTEEVLYGPFPPLPGQPGIPPDSSPFRPGTTGPATPLYPPSSPDRPPLPPPPIPPPPSVAVNLVVNGLTTPVAMICDPIRLSQPVTIGGSIYSPVFRLFLTQGGVTINPDGQPKVSVGYDQQPDGSVAFHFGPISVEMSMRSADPSALPAQCQPNMGQ